MKNNIIRYVSLVLLIAWMAVIFSFSAQPAEVSDETSEGLVEKIVSRVYPGYDLFDDAAKERIIERFSDRIRTAAHFTEFAILGVLLFIFIGTFKRLSINLHLIISVASGLIYAVSDEIHQIFVENRACELFDIAIDFCGILIAATACYLIALRGVKNEQ